MSRIYDNWERLVEATLKREQLRDLALCESFSSIASDFSFDSFREDFVAKHFSFYELRHATRNFRSDSILEEGGFDRVFKGWIDECTLTAGKPGSGLAIAVKKLEFEEFQGQKEWLKEVEFLGQLCHPNLVKLIGYCSEGDIRLLVYEFMPEGSLWKHLSRKGGNYTLSWDTRINVAIGVARGLSFLHEGDPQLIHGNVESSNILLDGDFGAKLSGFTLTKLRPSFDVMPGSWSPRGYGDTTSRSPPRVANGYDAPEYVHLDKLTAKCDVYSFGVVLIELLCGRRASQSKRRFSGEQDLVEWARPRLVSKRMLFPVLMDAKFEGQYPKKKAYEVAILASQCVSSDPKRRPCMKEVLGALEKIQGPKTGI